VDLEQTAKSNSLVTEHLNCQRQHQYSFRYTKKVSRKWKMYCPELRCPCIQCYWYGSTLLCHI